MRQITTFDCDGATLVGTLDTGDAGDAGDATTGLLIVSGGNEIRIGAHRGMARLARDVAAHGHPVFRFDRRGIGDSDGINGWFESARSDILTALSAFRSCCPVMQRVIAFGNCDAATALRLHLSDQVDGLVLANPWLMDSPANDPAPAATRAYYADRLRNPQAWAGLLRGAVNLRTLAHSLRTAARRHQPTSLAGRFAGQMTSWPVETHIILAARDGTALAFKAEWDQPIFAEHRHRCQVHLIDSASHSFANDTDHAALKSVLLDVLGR